MIPYDRLYIEPFGGSAAVLLNREPSPIEIYNDLDGGLVNLFRVLRDHGDELIRRLGLTPYARSELASVQENPEDPIEWARHTFVKARQSIMGIKDGKSWATSPRFIRNRTSIMISRWLQGIDKLYPVIERLRHVKLECRDAFHVITKNDTPETVFYLDPPYPKETRSSYNDYIFEMTDDQHDDLIELVRSLEGKAAISSYHSDKYDKAFKDWWIHEEDLKHLAGRKAKRQDVVWMNYDPKAVVGKDQTRISDF